MELLDVVDENNEMTGKQEDKDVIHGKGLWHREIAVWIMNEKGELLIQKRAATKKQNPNMWGLVAGHIDAGEEPIHAAQRETMEEIGLEADEKDFNPLFIEKMSKSYPNKNQVNSCFEYWYVLKTTKKVEEYKIQEEELSEVKYISIEELEQMAKDKESNSVFPNLASIEKFILILKEKRKENV